MPHVRKCGATIIFYEIIVVFENFYNPLMILHLKSPWFWKSDQVCESYNRFSIFGPNAPNKETMPHPFFMKLLFYLKIFTILPWLFIQSTENQIRYLKVTVNFLFLVQMPQISKYSATPIFYEIIVLYENFYNLLMILHPTSPCIWKLVQVLESYRQFSIFGPTAPNKEIECCAHLSWNYYFIWKLLESSHDSASHEPLVSKIGSGTWKLQPVFHFWPKCPI